MAEECVVKRNLRVCVSGGHQDGFDPIYVEECYKLGKIIAKMGFRLDYGFSNSGVMGAVARGVIDEYLKNKDKGEKGAAPIIGVTTKEYYDLYEKDELLNFISEVVIEDSLENRKRKLLEADLVVFAPGGVGTLDELAYDCVAMQDGFLKNKPFIIYNIDNFFYHILETLKELSATGFATRMPFIVVDNSEEAETALRLLKLKYNNCENGTEAYANARQIAYEMPYFIKKKLQTHRYVEDLLDEVENIRCFGTEGMKQNLASEIERAYLEKEIERMYDRLARTGRETGIVSEKLAKLKKRKSNTYNAE